MAKIFSYSSFKIIKIKDIDTLISLIKTKGNFNIKDYESLLRKATKSPQPARIRRRLIKEVYPLIGIVVPASNNNVSEATHTSPLTQPLLHSKKEKKDFWNKDYKASDFVITEGKISIGKYFLKSVRIHEIHPSWLRDIKHIFHIAPECNRKGEKRFHFVPYTDLSLLLNDVSEQKEIQKINQRWEYNLLEYLHIQGRDINAKFKEISINADTKDKKKILEWDYFNVCCPQICIPMSDVIIEDGKISVITEKAKFTIQPYKKHKSEYMYGSIYKWVETILPNENEYIETPSWSGFYEKLLREHNKDIINKNIEELRNKYLKDVNNILKRIKDLKSISFDTYQSKIGFYQKNEKEYLYLFLDEKFKLHYPFKNYDLYRDFISDRFEYENITLDKIANIIDNNWETFKNYSDWLLSDIIPSKHITEKRPNYNKELRVVTDYYKNRLKIVNKFCCKNNNVTFFTEDVSHCSDDWYCKGTEINRTFMIWSKYRYSHTITLIPTDNRYAKYEIYVNTSICSLDVASYIIWRFFTSNINNKRQGFQPGNMGIIFNLFGIYDMIKYK